MTQKSKSSKNSEAPTALTVEASNLSITTQRNIDVSNIADKTLPVIAGVEITTDLEGRFNLNALHKASGSANSKRPSLWLITGQAQELIQELSKNSCLGQEVVKLIKGGSLSGTFAHELLAISYAGWISPAFQLQVNQTFIDYRTGKLASVIDPMQALNDPAFLRGTLLTYTEKVITLENQVEEMRPDVEAFNRIAKADGSLCVTNAAKDLQVRPKELFCYLSQNGWIYKRAGSPAWSGYQGKIQQGLLEQKIMTQIVNGVEHVREQIRITPKGLTKLSKILLDVIT